MSKEHPESAFDSPRTPEVGDPRLLVPSRDQLTQALNAEDCLPCPSHEERQLLLQGSLQMLTADERARLFPVLDQLFASLLRPDALLSKDVDNPLTHHTTVLAHMMQIAKGENFSAGETQRAAALALLHDNWPAKKVTREMRSSAKSDAEKQQLEQLNLTFRTDHMTKGALRAREMLAELNIQLGREEFAADDIDAICGVIEIHDHPSMDKTIPGTDHLAVAFREADRLWMQSPEGVRADLSRKGVAEPSLAECIAQAHKNLGSYRKERELYAGTQERFCDDETFFRTKTGYAMFRRYREEWQSLSQAIKVFD